MSHVRTLFASSLSFFALVPLVGCALDADEQAASLLLDDVTHAQVTLPPEQDAYARVEATGSWQAIQSFGSNPGTLNMYLYTPKVLRNPAPIVVAMHGCTQTASDYAAATGWNELADVLGFYVIYPEQSLNNNSARCFNWAGEYGDTTNLIRGGGENQSIRSMVQFVQNKGAIDSEKIFVNGFSAGAAMAELMLATWPDVFSAGSIMAGIPYWCGDTVNEATACMGGVNKSPSEWGNLVTSRGFPSGYAGRLPRVSLWHGSKDTTVATSMMNESMEQWTTVNGLTQTPSSTETLSTSEGSHVHKEYKNGAGKTLVETWLIDGMAHAVSIDPNGAGYSFTCGSSTKSYTDDEDLCSTWRSAQFFGLDNADTTAPVVAITSPTDGATVSGVVSIQVAATDETGVVKAELLVDGVLSATSSAAPFVFSWDASKVASGAHTLSVKVSDAAGNSASDLIDVTVTGGVVDTIAPVVNVTSPSAGATVSGTVSLTATASDNTGMVGIDVLVDGVRVGSCTSSPCAVSWNSATVADGSHSVSAQAFDAAGNVGMDNDTTFTTKQGQADFKETFSSSSGPDNTGWTLGTWTLSSTNNSSTAGQSITAASKAKFNTVTKTASLTVTLGNAPVLSFYRKLELYAANTSAVSKFQVKVNTEVVYEKSLTGPKTAKDTSFVAQTGISLSKYANQTVTLTLVAEASDKGSNLSYCNAWVDDILIDYP